MAPPRTSPRLADLKPLAVAAIAVERVHAQVVRLAFHLSPELELPPSTPGAESCELGLSIAALTTYAQTGAAWDWEGAEEALDAVSTTVGALWGSASDRTSTGPIGDHEDELDDEDPVAVVLLAAWARATIEGGGSVTLRELGALAGVEVSGLRKLAASGELAATSERPARVRAKGARRWLSGRGVAGFA